ncbi:hypothetical protein Poly30_33600 [Planctomycetes bacterium Poly30]|uniref:Uncharacterized protein n=1 Tax=Saltatorellus ferox TaxID=2528018 RepID=A0A518EUQ6_9BACT|nr:hypothetical protein Poly30_33600 [Planctomycetes bacterium Poly30]
MPASELKSEASLDELVFQYLEAHDRSREHARRFLDEHRRTASDHGRALESAIQKLSEVGLLDDVEAVRDWVVADYSIERRLGRGGMGDVFLARPVGGGPPRRAEALAPRALP